MIQSGATCEGRGPGPVVNTEIHPEIACTLARSNQTSGPFDLAPESNLAAVTGTPPSSKLENKTSICPYPRCGRSFAREADLLRHINSKHERTQTFLCPVKGCFKGQNRRAFTRSDKLKAHLQAMHGPEDIAVCPEKECPSAGVQLIELQPHIRYGHHLDLVRSLNGAIPQWYCPVKPCSIRKSHQNLWDHILEHYNKGDTARLEATTTILQTVNISLIKSGCVHGLFVESCSQSTARICCCPITAVTIICPVCLWLCHDAKDFRQHMVDVHLIDPSQQEHFKAWKQYCRQYGPSTFHGPEKTSWILHESFRGRSYIIPVCEWSQRVVHRDNASEVNHHISMYRTDWNELKPYRRQILELYPRFGEESCWKPVWDDLAGPRRISAEEAAESSLND